MSLLDDAVDTTATFESLGIDPQLIKAITALGFKQPTKIQAEAIPPSIEGNDIIALAETGSGKTASYAIPILQSLLKKPSGLFACVMVPTRELGYQVSEQFQALGSTIGVKTVVVVGGVDLMQQAVALARKPHIVIATPGRLVYHLENTKGFSMHALKYLVLDEADRLLDMDFEEEINKVLRVVPHERRTFLYSATMTNKVNKLQRASLRNPVKVQVSSKYQTVETLVQQYLFIPHKYKECHLLNILNDFAGNTAIIFAATCATSARITLMLRNLGIKASPLNGDMSQPKRLQSLNRFKAGESQILVATDVAARGLDIPHVDLVINFDVPGNPKDYVHRVGRTARAGRSGRAITLVTQYDVELYQRIEELIEKKLEVYPSEDAVALSLFERVTEALRITSLQMRDMNLYKGKGEDSEEGHSRTIKRRRM